MKAAILAIGDEIVSGLTHDTNSAHVAQALREIRVEVVAGFSVEDDEDRITKALERALEDADLVITTGGLGPTTDDLTTACISRVAGLDLMLHEPSLEIIVERFRSRGLEMPENNRRQALFPTGSTIIPNPLGTAPGFICPVDRGGNRRFVAALPGVPREMTRMVAETLVPWAAARSGVERVVSRVFSTFGLAESRLDELLTGTVRGAEGRLAFRAAFPRVQARVTLTGAEGGDLEQRLEHISDTIRSRLGNHLYAEEDIGLETVVGSLLGERRLTLAVAESCTGGLIGHRITDVPGSSAYFLLGITAYSNEAKRRLFGVREETLERFGAVSIETAAEMAAGVRRTAGADLAVATTGIAGPGGGSSEKPVGTVCIALDSDAERWVRRYDLGARDRGWIKEMTAQLALERIRRHLLAIPDR